MTPYDTGVIHGRFQVVHNDHVTYLMAGYDLCRHLYIGISNPDPQLSAHEKSDPHRSSSHANPLTYYERYELIQTVLIENGAHYTEFTIVPFPINHPELIRHYTPPDAVYFLTIYDDWGREKLLRFQSLGLNTHVLWERPETEKGLQAKYIRKLMADGSTWEQYVPETTAQLLKEWHVPERIKKSV